MSEITAPISQQYIEVKIPIPNSELGEILVAELSEVGYGTFAEYSDRLEAFVETEAFDKAILGSILAKYTALGIGQYSHCLMEDKNWNEEWEKNFAPVVVNDKLRIRATFHQPDPAMRWEVVIDPKMSFGTGHHETTALVLANQTEIDFDKKTVLDVGCGTGILSVFASIKGASSIVAIDNNPWCIENTTENLALNQIENCEIRFGTITETVAQHETYDVVIANITRNIILNELPFYAQHTKPEGTLILSGFFEHDMDEILEKTSQLGLEFISKQNKNNWVSPVFTKIA